MRTATVLVACSPSLDLLSCNDVVAQTVTGHGAREERPGVVDLEEQLEGFRVTKGSLLVTAGADRKDGTPAAAALHVAVRWLEPAEDAPMGFVPAKVLGSDPVNGLGWVTTAIARGVTARLQSQAVAGCRTRVRPHGEHEACLAC